MEKCKIMAKTKAETLEQLQQVLLDQELQNIRVTDALGNAIDYIKSSHDLRQEQQEQSDYHDREEKENKNE